MKIGVTVIALLIAVTVFAAQSGEDLFYEKCSGCHSSSLSLQKQRSFQGWISTIKRMKQHGVRISTSESKSVADFLSGGK